MTQRYEREIEELLAYKARKEAALRRRRLSSLAPRSTNLMRLGLVLIMVGLVLLHLVRLPGGEPLMVVGGVLVLASWIRSYIEPAGGDGGFDSGKRWRGRIV